MFSRTSITRQAVRLASSKSEKIPVQLLKDHDMLGVAGQIIRVRPAFMRNYLHADNKACYITKEQGPRLPVVERQNRAPMPAAKKAAPAPKAPEPKDTPAMSLDELSSMFSNMRSARRAPEQPAAFTVEASTAAYTLAELADGLPQTYTVAQAAFPVTKAFLVQAVFNATGIEVPAAALKLKDGSGAFVEDVAAAGTYTWIFSAAGEKSTLQKTLRVQS